MESDPDPETPEKAALLGYLAWALWGGGLLIAFSVVASYGSEWGVGFITAYKVLLCCSSFAFISAVASLVVRRNGIGIAAFVISGITLLPLLWILHAYIWKF